MKRILIGISAALLSFTVASQANNSGGILFRYAINNDDYLTADEFSGVQDFSPEDLYVGEPTLIDLPVLGGTGPYSWQIIQGNLPNGTSINMGKIIGTPETAGEYPLTLRITDISSVSFDTEEFSLHVYDQLTANSIKKDGFVGENFTATLAVQGGKAPYDYMISGGSLPVGVSFANGTISGSPSQPGFFSADVRISDQNLKSVTVKFESEIKEKLIGNYLLDDGYVGESYLSSLSASGGVKPYHWELLGASTLPDGLSLSSDGIVSGTPIALGTSTFNISVFDDETQDAPGVSSISIYAMPKITQGEIGPIRPNEPLTIKLAAVGGKSDLTWNYSGELPSGLSISPSGTLSGTPTTAGKFSPIFQVTDANSKRDTSSVSVLIADEMIAHIPNSIEGYVGDDFSTSLNVSGGISPYEWTATGLPSGFDIDRNTGFVSGRATVAGESEVTVTVTDKEGSVTTSSLLLNTYNPPSISSLPVNGVVGSSYEFRFQNEGGKAPFVWTVSSGHVPTGLSWNDSGVLAGIPTAAGDYSFTVQVTDANGRQALQPATISFIHDGFTAVAGTPADAYRRNAFSHTVSATGGQAPYRFSATGLPAGLSLNSTTGVISGSPTTSGERIAKITATDSLGATSVTELPLGVLDLPVISNNELAEAQTGGNYSYTYSVNGGRAPFTWEKFTGTLPAGLTLSRDGVLSGNTTIQGDYVFTVRVTDANGKSATIVSEIPVKTLIAIDVGVPADAYVSDPFTHTVSASGGYEPYMFTATNLPSGLAISSSGVISGIPTSAGVTTATINAIDSGGNSVNALLQLTVLTLPVVANEPPAEGSHGIAYTHGYVATGGRAPYSWALSSGSLPTGITLSSSGTLSGTPTSTGNFTFTVRVTDANGKTASKQSTVQIYPGVSVNPGTPADGYLSTLYSHAVTASSGKGPYIFSATNLPNGLTISSSSGLISGSPTATGTQEVTVIVRDSLGSTGSAKLDITTYQLPQITNIPDAESNAGSAYSHTYTRTGGKGPFTWSIASGSLPSGLTLSSNGNISGTTTTGGQYSFVARVTDVNGMSATRNSSILVFAPLGLNVGTAPDAYPSNSFSHTVFGTGGEAPYLYTASNLPSGLSINSQTGVISGTPSAAGNRTATINVVDNRDVFASRNLDINVYALPTISNSPATSRLAGVSYSFTYSVTGGKGPFTWNLASGSLPSGLTLSSSGTISGTPTTASNYSFTVRVSDANGKTATRSSTMLIEPNVITKYLSNSSVPVNLSSVFTAAEWNSVNQKVVIINPSVVIGTNSASHALNIPAGWAGDLTLENRGSIQGIGGAANSGAGGNALNIAGKGIAGQRVKIANYGTILGGGGGGGRGGTGGAGVANTIVREPASGYFPGSATWLDTTNTHLAIYFDYNDLNTGNTIFSGHIANSLSVTQRVVGAYTYHRGPQRMPTNLGLTPFEFYRTYNSVVATAGGAGGNGGPGQGYGSANGEGTAGLAGGAGAGAGGWGNWGGTWGSAGQTGATGNAGNNGGGFAGTAGGAAGASVVGSTHAEFIVTGTRQGPIR